MENAATLSEEMIGKGTPTLRVYEGFGTIDEETGISFIFRAIDQEKKIIDVFKKNGFRIEHGGDFKRENPLEIGISRDDDRSSYDRDKRVAYEVGLAMPQAFSPEQILSNEQIVVAKIPSTDRGEMKYLLENNDQKVKFITWALLHQKLGDLFYEKDPHSLLNQLFSKVAVGDFSDPVLQDGWLDSWVFEEFIQSPGDYNTSFRIVADAFGNVHYGQVARSDQPKNSYLEDKKSRTGNALEDILGGTDLTDLLRQPNSPFYLHSKAITSNIARGGRSLLLNGSTITDPTDRDVLTALAIDPDHPTIPADIQRISSNIGQAFRGDYPHVGIDFMKRDTGEFVLLEVNKGPQLRPEVLGLDANATPMESELVMMQRVIDKMPR